MAEKEWQEYEYYDYEKAVVIDNGSGIVKVCESILSKKKQKWIIPFIIQAGFAGEAQPSVTFPSVVGIPKGTNPEQDLYVAQEALDKLGSVKLEYVAFRMQRCGALTLATDTLCPTEKWTTGNI